MNIADSLIHAARFSPAPQFSLFHVSSRGEYALLEYLKTEVSFGSNKKQIERHAREIESAFKRECLKPETIGLEIRCDGMRVDI